MRKSILILVVLLVALASPAMASAAHWNHVNNNVNVGHNHNLGNHAGAGSNHYINNGHHVRYFNNGAWHRPTANDNVQLVVLNDGSLRVVKMINGSPVVYLAEEDTTDCNTCSCNNGLVAVPATSCQNGVCLVKA